MFLRSSKYNDDFNCIKTSPNIQIVDSQFMVNPLYEQEEILCVNKSAHLPSSVHTTKPSQNRSSLGFGAWKLRLGGENIYSETRYIRQNLQEHNDCEKRIFMK